MTLARLVMLLVLLQLPPAGFPPAAAGAADPAAVSPRRVTEGTLFWKTGQGQVAAPVLATDVEIRVTGMIARARVHQEFTNPAAEWAEGVYVFPLPDDAAVDHLRMRVGDRIIEGMIRERAAAKAAYTQARQQGQRASLVEQERPNVFTTSVANIPPGASITIEIEYQQTVHYDAGEFRLRFPMVVGPRYLPGEPVAATDGAGLAPDTDQVPDASRISPPVRPPDEGPINPIRLRVELDPGLPLAAVDSSYHPIHAVPLGGDRYEITLAEQIVAADRDFELVWRPVAGEAPTAALLVEPKGEFMYALLMVMPPAASAPRARVPREVTFVLDHSGSMGGASIDQAKAALILALHRLTPADTFNVIRFNHRTDSLFAAPQPASTANVRAAERYVGAIRADGGTEMLPALERALEPTEGAGRLRQVIFLTDGAVGNESRLFEAIRERLGDRRLFTIGIGSAPNSHFMREAARLGRGTFTYIGSPAEVQEKMVALFRKVEAPAVADITLELAGAADAELLPVPDPGSLPGRAGGRRAPGAHAARARGRARPHRIDRVDPRGADPRGGRGRGALDPLGAAEDRRAARSAIGGGRRRPRASGGDRDRAQASPGESLHEPGGGGCDARAARRRVTHEPRARDQPAAGLGLRHRARRRTGRDSRRAPPRARPHGAARRRRARPLSAWYSRARRGEAASA